MPSHSRFDWPFFTDAHRSLAARAAAWAGEHLPEGPDRGTVGQECRRLVREYGDAGWLEPIVGARRPAGAGPDVRSLCIVRETLAQRSGLADFSFAMQGLGSAPIALYGSDDLRRSYLPRTAAGAAIAAFAISEPDAGSDVGAISTTARRDGDAFVIDGMKTWISNAGVADYYVVFARTGEAPGSRGLSAFVVDADARGLAVVEDIPTLAPHPLGSLAFAGCRVDRDRMLGKPGEGFVVAMRTLDLFRPGVAAAALGFARRALEEATRHAGQRKLFGQTLADMQLTQAAIGDMATELDAGALLTYRAAWLLDTQPDVRATKESAMAKFFATEAAQRIVDRCQQMFGGRGVVTGSPLERLYREVRSLRIYEGATEVQRLIAGRAALGEAARGEA